MMDDKDLTIVEGALTEVAPTPDLPTLEPTEDLLTPRPLIALTPADLPDTQRNLAGWCVRKKRALQIELKELQESEALAKKRKWSMSGWAKQIKRTVERITFYDKVKLATEAGFLVVPSFPINVFAVRIGKKAKLIRDTKTSTWSVPVLPDQPAPLDAEATRYVSPQPEQENWTDTNAKNQIVQYFRAAGVKDMEFPAMLAEPQLILATKRAISLNVFDEIGMVGGHVDPIVVGTILRPGHWGVYERMNFFIGWWLAWEEL
jgi:hypothetical protein